MSRSWICRWQAASSMPYQSNLTNPETWAFDGSSWWWTQILDNHYWYWDFFLASLTWTRGYFDLLEHLKHQPWHSHYYRTLPFKWISSLLCSHLQKWSLKHCDHSFASQRRSLLHLGDEIYSSRDALCLQDSSLANLSFCCSNSSLWSLPLMS